MCVNIYTQWIKKNMKKKSMEANENAKHDAKCYIKVRIYK